MMFVEPGATTPIAQYVGDMWRRESRSPSDRLRVSRGRRYCPAATPVRRRSRLRTTARIDPPVSFIGEGAGARTAGDLIPEDPDAVWEKMDPGV